MADLALSGLLAVLDAVGGKAWIVAGRDNADEMFELDMQAEQPTQNHDGGAA